jgi:hypothetical protein
MALSFLFINSAERAVPGPLAISGKVFNLGAGKSSKFMPGNPNEI